MENNLLEKFLKFPENLNNSDLDNQTGPAIREDYEVIKKHHQMLNEQHLSVYKSITQSIIKTKKEK